MGVWGVIQAGGRSERVPVGQGNGGTDDAGDRIPAGKTASCQAP